jgi:crotonobetainyl-CoA:carnitine CoA-transferase CaiB-like acyl-CoA transferase
VDEPGRDARVTAALDGIRVLDFTQMMMGPWASQFLADMGADVIKVERPGAGEWERGLHAVGDLLDGQSPFFLAMNRNKRSVALNLKDERARDVCRRLAERSDLVMENFRPGVMDRLGLGYEDLRRNNPSIVYVSGTGFGPDGPYVDRPGQDLLIQAMSGLAAYGGRRGDPPTPAGSSIVDASTAILLAFSAMVALFHRERSGEGQRVDVSLFNTAIALQCQELAAFMNLERRFDRSEAGIGGAWLSAPFGIYRTADGWIAFAMASLSVIGDLLDLPELAKYDDERGAYDHRDEVRELMQARLLQRPTDVWLGLLATRDVWCAPVQTFDDVVDDPQVAHNELLTTVGHPNGRRDVRVVGVPMRFSRTPGTIRTGPPAVGQHTEQVLEELGFGRDDVAAMRDEGLV